MGTVSNGGGSSEARIQEATQALAERIGPGLLSGAQYALAGIVPPNAWALSTFLIVSRFWREYPEWTQKVVGGYEGLMATYVDDWAAETAQMNQVVDAIVAEHPL